VVVTGSDTAIGSYIIKELDAKPFFSGDCDVLINCYGKSKDKIAIHQDYEQFGYIIDRNLISVYDAIIVSLKYMRERGFGRIINMSSVVPHLGVPGTSAYSAAKAGLWGLTKVIAKENADKNVLINCLNLGYMDGGMTHRIKDYEKLKDTIPVKKFGDFKEITNAIEFLVRSDYITGTNIEINGGLW
jgi:NAD(P)-dependent dehydrogenase (short-subunit alcohol dehydrogenase family)